MGCGLHSPQLRPLFDDGQVRKQPTMCCFEAL